MVLILEAITLVTSMLAIDMRISINIEFGISFKKFEPKVDFMLFY